MMSSLMEDAKVLQENIVLYRRFLHVNAETGMELKVTSEYVIRELELMGYIPQKICNWGVVATVGMGISNKTFLLRADMDALPILEEADCDFKCSNGSMHACGHDLHTSMLLGAAKLLKERENEIEGTVKLMFQPGEETLQGAKAMIEVGILENPKVDAAMMMHVVTGMPVKAGMVVSVGEGVIQSASDWFVIKVKGKGTHGAMPESGVDPLNVISHIYLGLQNIIAREISPIDPTVLTIGQIHGGNAGNIIPDSAFLEGTIRTFSNESRKFIKDRVITIAKSISESFRATAVVEFTKGCPSNVNDEKLLNEINKYTKELVGEDYFVDGKNLKKIKVNFGSEDFSYISERVPSVTFYLGAGDSSEGYVYPAHHPKAKFYEKKLYMGSAIYANAAIKWLENNK